MNNVVHDGLSPTAIIAHTALESTHAKAEAYTQWAPFVTFFVANLLV